MKRFVISFLPLFAALLLFAAPQAQAAWSRVQGGVGRATTGPNSTQAASFGATVASGNHVFGFTMWACAAGTDGITVNDDKSNSYTIVDTVFDSGGPSCMTTFFKLNVTNGPITITAHYSGAGSLDLQIVAVDAFSGGNSSSAANGHAARAQTSPGSGTDAIKTNSTFGANTDIRYGVTSDPRGSAATLANGTGYTLAQGVNTDAALLNCSWMVEWMTAAGALDATFTASVSPPLDTLVGGFAVTTGGGGGPTTHSFGLMGVGR